MSKKNNKGVVIGNLGIDPGGDEYHLPEEIELPGENIAGVCPHGFLPDERCKLCGREITEAYREEMKHPRRR